MAIDQRFRIVVSFGPCAEGGNGGLADVEVFSGHKFQISLKRILSHEDIEEFRRDEVLAVDDVVEERDGC